MDEAQMSALLSTLSPPPQSSSAFSWASSLLLGLSLLLLSSCAGIRPVSVKFFTDHRHAVLMEDLVYPVGISGMRVVVPAGFVTDYASVPPELMPTLGRNQSFQDAAVVHDFLYWTQPVSRSFADQIFEKAMIESGVRTWPRSPMSIIVRMRGESAWITNQRERAQGLPKYLTLEQRQNLPAGISWPDYRQQLYAQGHRDPAAWAKVRLR